MYGFGLLFRVADECIGRHLHERRPDLRGGDDSADSSAMVSVESMREPPALEGTTQREQKMGVTPEDAPAEAHLEDELVPRSKIVKTVRSPTDDTASIMTSAADKYELETYEEERGIVEETLLPSLETVHDGTVDGKASEVTRRKYLSAKERRRAKRGLVEDSSQVESPLSNGIESVSPAKVPVQPPPKPIRGKKKKMQKAKEKYGDQDEEERRLRMELLQSAGKPGKKDEEKVVVVEHSVAEKVPKRSQEEKLAEKMGTVLHVDDDAENMQGPDMDDEDDAEAALDVGIDDDDDNEGDRAEIKRMLEEENVAAVEQDDAENLSYLDSLTVRRLE